MIMTEYTLTVAFVNLYSPVLPPLPEPQGGPRRAVHQAREDREGLLWGGLQRH